MEIVGVRKDNEGVIIEVAVLVPVAVLAPELKEIKDEEYFTNAGGKKAKVYPKTSSKGRDYLTTNPDDTNENNLDFLPQV